MSIALVNECLFTLRRMPKSVSMAILEYDPRFTIKNGKIASRDGCPLIIHSFSAKDYRYDTLLNRILPTQTVGAYTEVLLNISNAKDMIILYSVSYSGVHELQYQVINYSRYGNPIFTSTHFYYICDNNQDIYFDADEGEEGDVFADEQEWE